MFMSSGNEDREASDRTNRDFLRALSDGTAESDNPYQAPGVEVGIGQREHAGDELGFRRAKRRILLAILLLFALSGFLAPLTHGDATLQKGCDLVTGIALAVLLLQWCEYDRREHAIKRWRYFGLMMIVCPGPVILMPIYFLATRGSRGLLSILKASVCFALAIVAVLAGFAVSAAIFGGWELLLH
jgi:hypothetical protein